MNNWSGIGRLTKDPKLQYTPNGIAVAAFTIAVNRPFKNQNGENEADFINCVTWRKQAENLANYQSKGNMIGVTGRIQTRNFDNQEGRKVFITEVLAENIQYLESKKSGMHKPQPTENYNQINGEVDAATEGSQINISDDELPF